MPKKELSFQLKPCMNKKIKYLMLKEKSFSVNTVILNNPKYRNFFMLNLKMLGTSFFIKHVSSIQNLLRNKLKCYS